MSRLATVLTAKLIPPLLSLSSFQLELPNHDASVEVGTWLFNSSFFKPALPHSKSHWLNTSSLFPSFSSCTALAAGCSIVFKSAENTPLGALLLTKLFEEVGYPKGTLNLVTGTGSVAGQALAEHMVRFFSSAFSALSLGILSSRTAADVLRAVLKDIDKIAFTGSTAVGRHIAKTAAASNLKGMSTPSICSTRTRRALISDVPFRWM
jgi:hypothetical protein